MQIFEVMVFDYGNGSSKYSRAATAGSDDSGSSSKNSTRHVKFDESGSSMQYSSRHLESDVETGSSKHSSESSASSSKESDSYPEVINMIGGIKSNDFQINPGIVKGWGNINDFQIHTVVFDENESSKRSDVILEIARFEGDIFVSTEELRFSSSSLSSSTDDQFQADLKLSKSISGISGINSGNSSSKLEQLQIGFAGSSSTSKSQVSKFSHESTLTQSPPIQVMDRRIGDFDPYRIPSAVFARSESTTPEDLSVASNESLFSIQVGYSSFSKVQILNQNSGELSSTVGPGVDKKSVEFDRSEATAVSDEAVKVEKGLNAEEPFGEEPAHPVVSLNSAISNHSDDSGFRGCSFACQGRKKNKKQKKCAWPSCPCCNCRLAFCNYKWPSCCCSGCSWAFCNCTRPSCRCCSDCNCCGSCSDCSWAFCKCKWPSCCCCFDCSWVPCNCKWPSWSFCNCTWPNCSCSGCSFAFCCCWNCSIIKWCCHSCTVCKDGRNVSKKEKAGQQQQQQEQPLASALHSKSSSCCNCCYSFPSCQWRCRRHLCCSCNCL